MGRLKDFYSTYFANLLTDGNLSGRKNLSALGIKPLFNRIVTRKYIKRVISINKIPYNYDKSLIAVLNKIAYDFSHSCKIYINTYSTPYKVDVTNQKFLEDMHSVENRYDKYRDLFGDLKDSEQLTGKRLPLGNGLKINISSQGLRKLEEDYNSYKYIYKQVSDGESLANTFIFIEVIAENNKNMKNVLKHIEEYLKLEGFGYQQLAYNSSYYMMNYSPASYAREFPSKEFMYNLTSSENISRLMPYNCNGFIGDGFGTMFGLDMRSKSPFILNMFESGHSQINVILGPAGTGKTYLAESSAPGFISQGIHCSAIDVKGREWKALKHIVKDTLILDISETSDMFVNTMRVDDLVPKTKQEAQEFFNISYSATLNLCKILIDYKEDDESAVDAILKTCIDKVYSTNGIDRNNSATFNLSRNLKYTDIIPCLESLKASSSYSSKINLINDIRLNLDTYFNRSNVFKGREVSLKDIIDSPMVIYTLNKNDDQSQSKVDSIRAFMISYLDMKKIAIRKSQKKGTVCYYEELQRKEEFLSLITFISAIVTGARSNNVSVFLLCNTISILKERDMQPITSNINNYFCSPFRSKDDYDLLSELNCGDIVKPLKKMGDNPEQFDHMFFVKYDTGVNRGETLIKTYIHPKYAKFFNTRDTIHV